MFKLYSLSLNLGKGEKEMKTLIAYSSKTGNTKKVGEAVAKAFDDVTIKDISQIDHLDYDLIVIGTWIDKGTADTKALKFIETIKGKKTAYFFTLGAYPDSQHAMDCITAIEKLFTDNNNELIGSYHCQGAIDPKLISWMSELPAEHPHSPNPERLKRWEDAANHPDQDDFNAAEKTFKEILAGL